MIKKLITLTPMLLCLCGCEVFSSSLETINTMSETEMSEQSLVQSQDFNYLGSFRVPRSQAGVDISSTLAYSGLGLAYNANRQSLFISGHDHGQLTAEVSIPRNLGTGAINQLPVSTMIRAPFDATNGTLENLLNTPDGFARIGDYLVVDNRLLISGFHYYDTANNQYHSHFLSNDLSQQNYLVSAPFRLSTQISPRWSGGAMTHIPPRWQEAFGGQYLSGASGLNIVSNASAGPTLTVFSNSTINGDLNATLAVGYPLTTPLAPLEQKSTVWNLTSEATGVFFPNNFNSVLFVGRHGLGDYCYGSGEQCGDPESVYQGTHAYPYQYQVWAYKADDLANVANGKTPSYGPVPYAVWKLDIPFKSPNTRIGGVAWDDATKRLYVSQQLADETYPLIHVYSVGY